MKKVDVGVGGRFHSDQAVEHFLHAGWDARLYTSLPASRFPRIARSAIASFIPPELAFRGLLKLGFGDTGDELKMRWFGNWMARQLRQDIDLFMGWSSFSVESIRLKRCPSLVVRDSAHIDTQNEILREEFKQFGIRFRERPICRAREIEEYETADGILLLSEFAKKSFVARGIPVNRLHLVRLGCDLSRFRPAPTPPANQKLRVVYFGNLSLQKGVQYLLEAFSKIPAEKAELTLIGSRLPEFGPVMDRYRNFTWLGPKSQQALAQILPTQDVFVFPTLHDGFGQTLLQAMAVGLVPIVTPHCGASDTIQPGTNGMVVPIRSADSIREKIRMLCEDRTELSRLRHNALDSVGNYTWENYGTTLASVANTLVKNARK
jgi:glycosyltransferase involved in cell wall biosynthesis